MSTSTTAAAAAASPSTSSSSSPAKREKAAHSLFAGATAGAVEAFITYPTEFVKTRAQFGGQREAPLSILRNTVKEHGVKGLYAGCGALVVGNAAKAGVRFLTYDHLKAMLADENVSGGYGSLKENADEYVGQSERAKELAR